MSPRLRIALAIGAAIWATVAGIQGIPADCISMIAVSAVLFANLK